jgi:Chlorophyll A-B binding protein
MKTTAAILLVIATGASAFAPSSNVRPSMQLASEAAPIEIEVPKVTPINGWVPDKSLPMYGLPGAIGPLGFFDPLGFSSDKELTGAKRLREAEVMHCRVAMMAVIGYLIAENTPTVAFGFEHPIIANNMIPEISGVVMFPFFLAINIAEAFRANRGWVEPGVGELFTLRESYYPGDLGFDPLGLKPTNAKEFASMQEKELSNGRLAMIAAAGFCAQEQINGMPILANLGL